MDEKKKTEEIVGEEGTQRRIPGELYISQSTKNTGGLGWLTGKS